MNARAEDIDNDVVIEEVEKRPALYDKKLKEYSDVNFKIKAWEEISKIAFSNAWSNFMLYVSAGPKVRSNSSKLLTLIRKY